MKNKTIIIITHRLSTIKSADSIYVFNEGKIDINNLLTFFKCEGKM
jgi:ABC-type multidrug transport system fused ATPase/permease subunit